MKGESDIKRLMKSQDIVNRGTVQYDNLKQAYKVQEPQYEVKYDETAGCWVCSCSPSYYGSKYKRKFTCKHIAAVQLLHDRENRAFLLSKPTKKSSRLLVTPRM